MTNVFDMTSASLAESLSRDNSVRGVPAMSSSGANQTQRNPSAQALREVRSAYSTFGNLTQAERERLLIDQLPQVEYIATRIHHRLPPHVLLDDLIHAGVLGLIEAIQRFEPARHGNLKAYAKDRIHQAILDRLRGFDWGSRPLRRKTGRIEKARRKFRTLWDTPPPRLSSLKNPA